MQNISVVAASLCSSPNAPLPPPRTQAAFNRGINGVAATAKAWLITSGSDAGVMKLVGEAVAKSERSVPLIGIFPWGATNCRERLHDAIGKAAPYGKATPPSRDGAPLNCHHTHFVLVDSGEKNEAAWGSEIAFRAQLEATISHTKGVPIVQLVVQGGPGSLATVESTALEGKPIVVLTNSGGAATAIYNFCKGGLSAVEQKFRHMEARLANIKLLNDAYGEKLLAFYTLDESSSSPDLSSLLFFASVNMLNTDPDVTRLPVGSAVKHPEYGRGRIIEVANGGERTISFHDGGESRVFSNGTQPHPVPSGSEPWKNIDSGDSSGFDSLLSKALQLTIVWDRPDLAMQIMSELKERTGVADGEVGSRLEVAASFQRALELQQQKSTELLIKLTGLDISRVHMGRLFQQPDGDSQFLSSNGLLQIKLHQFIDKGPYLSGQRSEELRGVDFCNFRKAVSKFYHSLSPILSQQLRSQKGLPPTCPTCHHHHRTCARTCSRLCSALCTACTYCSGTEVHDIFFWLVCTGNEQLARTIWGHCDLPMHIVLLGALITRNMSQQALRGAAKLDERADTMLQWACGALDMAHDEAQAHHVLKMELCGRYTALDIAMHTGGKAFLNHSHCRSLIDEWWRGGDARSTLTLAADFSNIMLTLYIFFPFLNPDVWKANNKSQPSAAAGNVYDAVGLMFNILTVERARLADFAKRQQQPDEALQAMANIAPRQSRWQQVVDLHADVVKPVEMMSPLQSFYAAPAVRFVMRGIFHWSLVALYVLLILTTFKNPDILDELKIDPSIPWSEKLPMLSLPETHSWIEYMWLTWEVGMFFDMRHQRIMMVGLVSLGDSTDRSNGFLLRNLGEVLLLVAIAIRVSMEFCKVQLENDPCDPYEPGADDKYWEWATSTPGCDAYDKCRRLYVVYQALISIKVIETGVRSFDFLNDYEDLGVLIIVIHKMTGDIFLFSFILVVSSLSFMLAMAAQQSAGNYRAVLEDNPYDPFSRHGAFWAPLWNTFGWYELDNYSGVTAAALTWLYSFISIIVLVNLLVAMFSDTFQRVKSQAALEFIYLDCQRMFMYRDVVLSAPPVLNLPFILWDVGQRLQERCSLYWRPSEQLDTDSLSAPPPGSRSYRRRRSAHAGRPQAPARPKLHNADGKLFVEAYIKQQDQLPDDSSQNIARSILDGFDAAGSARSVDTRALKDLVLTLVHKLDALDTFVRKADLDASSPNGQYTV